MNRVVARLSLCALAAATALGCASPLPRDRALTSSFHAESSSAPDWYGQPLTWEKLQGIEHWLEGSGPDAWPESVPDAELELAQGRLELAKRDRTRLPASILDARLDLAAAGFRRVVASAHAGLAERDRAERGLAEIEVLRTGSAPVVGLPRILSRASWHASAPNPRELNATRRPWTRITVHHSATDSTDAAAIRRIQKNHMQGNGWGDIGYHFLIDGDGRIYQGRSLSWQGAHAGGQNNVANIGVCLLGDFDRAAPSPAALRSLEALLAALSQHHGISRRSVRAHKDFKATECPGRHLTAWLRRYTG